LEGTDLLLKLLRCFVILHIIGLRKQLGGLVRDDSLLAYEHSNFVTAPFSKLILVVLRSEGALALVRYVLFRELLPFLFKLLLGLVCLLLLWGFGWLSRL
jgi:hypothetical protein